MLNFLKKDIGFCKYLVLKRYLTYNFVLNKMNTKDYHSCIKVNLSPFPILYQKENIFLYSLFKKHGFTLRIAGGAVRDILLGIPPQDIDYATDATPTQMVEIFEKENMRILNRNGEKHGTVTVRINNSVGA